MTEVVAVGGGHGLAATLRACVGWTKRLTAIVSVADDGGSSGRIRAATGLPALGDLRRCLTSLAPPRRAVLAAALERRDLDGHAAGNVLLAALTAELDGDVGAAVAELAELLDVPAHVAVLPATPAPVELVARTRDGQQVRGQVAVEAAGAVDHVRVEPQDVAASAHALDAVASADLVVLGPGSLYGSVLAAAVVHGLPEALAAAPATRALVCNLRARAPETAGYDVAAHVHALRQHGIPIDVVVVQPGTLPRGDVGETEVVEADVAKPNALAHDPERLGSALFGLL